MPTVNFITEKTPVRWLEMSLVSESRVTVTEMCSETLPVPERLSQSRDEEPYNPEFIIYYFLLTISSKKLCPFTELLTATASNLQHSSDTGKGPGLSLNRAQDQVGLRSHVRLLMFS